MISMLTIKIRSKSSAQQPSGWHLYENTFKIEQQTSRVRKKKVRNSSMNAKVRKERGEGGTSGTRAVCAEDHCRADIHAATHGGSHITAAGLFPEGTAAHEEPMLEQVLLRGAAACGETTLEQGRSVRKKEQQRNCYKLTRTPLPMCC